MAEGRIHGVTKAPRDFEYGSDFDVWARRFDAHCLAQSIERKLRGGILRTCLDTRSFIECEQLGLTEAEWEEYDRLIPRLRTVLQPVSNYTDLKFKLRDCRQLEQETLEDFAFRLRNLGLKAYPNASDKVIRGEILRDQFVMGIRKDFIGERLLEDLPETLEAALSKARRLEDAKNARKGLQSRSVTGSIGLAHTSLEAGVSQVFNPESCASNRRTTGTGISQAVNEVAKMPSVDNRDSDLKSLTAAIQENTRVLSQFLAQMTVNNSSTETGNANTLQRSMERASGNSGGRSQSGNTGSDRRTVGGDSRAYQERTCYSCGEAGHYRNNCPNRNRSSGNDRRPGQWTMTRPLQ